MKLFKYLDLSNAGANTFHRIWQTIQGPTIWCSRPDVLNDPDEFSFSCDFNPSTSTVKLLAQVLVESGRYVSGEAHEAAKATLLSGRLEEIARPVIAGIVNACRDTLGVACFGASSSNSILWERYGGNGDGLCIEIDVLEPGLNALIFQVDYVAERVLHIDLILESIFDSERALDCYKAILLTKTEYWRPEAEIRFISKTPDVLLNLENSRVSRVVLGEKLKPSSALEIQKIVAEIDALLAIEVWGLTPSSSRRPPASRTIGTKRKSATLTLRAQSEH